MSSTLLRSAAVVACCLVPVSAATAATTLNPDHYTVVSGATLTVTAAQGVLANDSVVAPAIVQISTAPATGALSLNPDGSFSYASPPTFVGEERFTYSLTTDTTAPAATVTITVTPSFEVLHLFTYDSTTDTFPRGVAPAGNLVRGADGKFYGTTNGDGCLDAGNVFRVEADSSLTVIKKFQRPAGIVLDALSCVPMSYPNTTPPFPGDNGSAPSALFRASDGNLYGTTEAGGDWNQGTIYRLRFAQGQSNPTFELVHSFNCLAGEGSDPFGMLVEGSDGALYGTNGLGNADPVTGCWSSTAFKVNKDGSGFSVIAPFSDSSAAGFYQLGPVVVGRDGSVYGTSKFAAGPGTIFKISVGDPQPRILHTFDPSRGEGAVPASGLVRGIDGAMYGTAESQRVDALGHTTSGGTIFRVTEDGQFTTLYTFDAAKAGGLFTPGPPLRRGGDGRLYGATFEGGVFEGGGLYELDLPAQYGGPTPSTGAVVVLHEFDIASEGYAPYALMGVGADRHLYGASAGGGPDNAGALFGPLDVVVANVPPEAAINYSARGASGSTTYSPAPIEAVSRTDNPVTLTSQGTQDDDFDNLSFQWTTAAALDAPASSAPYGGINYQTVVGHFPIGTTPVTLFADDGAPRAVPGPLQTVTINVTVQHTLPPVVTVSPLGSTTIEATSAAGGSGAFTASAVDRVDGPTSAHCDYLSPSTFPIGTTTVTCTSTDSAGNIGSGTLTFVVRDTKAPVLSNVPPAISKIIAPTSVGSVVTYTPPTATDIADPSPIVVCAPVSGSTFSVGVTTVTCTAADASGNSSKASFTVTIALDRAPVATGTNVTTTLNAPIAIPLTATDADGQPLTYRIVTSPVHGTLSLSDNVARYTPAAGFSGADSFTWVANDGFADSNVAPVSVTVQSHSTPNCSAAAAAPAILWPPNHQLVPITLGGVTNGDGSPVTYTVTSIFQDEPTWATGSGDTPIDGVGLGTSVASVRAERSGHLNGRVYHIMFVASANGLSCTGDVTVGVPHDLGNGRVPVDDGPQYDSTTAAPTAADDTAATLAGVPVTIAVLSNDADPFGLPLTIVTATNAVHGIVAINGNGTVTYKPAPGFVGTDTFTYTVRDARGSSDGGTVTVTVAAHGDNDGCDHDRRRNGHYTGDGCEHERRK